MAPPKLGSDVSVCSRPCAPQATKRQGGKSCAPSRSIAILRLNAHQSRLLVLFNHENEFVMSDLSVWVAFEFGEMDVATVYGKQLIHFEDPESRLVTFFQPFVRVEGER